MPQPQTFLRFTTRGLLLVMLGLSVALAIAFSLLPPLLGITRGQMAVIAGCFTVGLLLFVVPVGLCRFRVENRAGHCLIRLPLAFPKEPSANLLGTICAISAALQCWRGYQTLVAGEMVWAAMGFGASGIIGGAALFLLLIGGSMTGIHLCERGIVRGIFRFYPWDVLRSRGTRVPESSEPSIEFYFASKWHRPELTPADCVAVEAILTQHKPGYAELGHV
jgi:hypothetical protein